MLSQTASESNLKPSNNYKRNYSDGFRASSARDFSGRMKGMSERRVVVKVENVWVVCLEGVTGLEWFWEEVLMVTNVSTAWTKVIFRVKSSVCYSMELNVWFVGTVKGSCILGSLAGMVLAIRLVFNFSSLIVHCVSLLSLTLIYPAVRL